MGKYLLRRAFAGEGLIPESIIWREKAAFSDAVGYSLADGLKALAARRYTDSEFEARRRKYDYARPSRRRRCSTASSFERHYPGQAEMIPGFWMPNPAWAGW